MHTLALALIQMTSSDDMGENIAHIEHRIDQAAEAGAQLIATPEMTSLLTGDRDILFGQIKVEQEDECLQRAQAKARHHRCWIMLGSLPVLTEEGRVANRSFLIDDRGLIRGRYDKIHMFDVDLDGAESYRESALYQPGHEAVVVNTPWGGLGLSICYDLRFGYLYHALAQAGAKLIAVPAAFTRPTGAAHWHALLRARAIETGCFIFAPAQCGVHAQGRKTYGHSLIVNPWGEIIADADAEPSLLQMVLNLDEVEAARRRIPGLAHSRQIDGIKIL